MRVAQPRALPASWLRLALLAVLQAWSICWPWQWGTDPQPIWWLQLLVMGLAYRVWVGLPGHSFRRGFMAGWWFGSVWLVATFWWLFISMHQYGGLPSPLAAIAVVALAGALALYYGAAMGLFCQFRHALGPAASAVLFAAVWLLAELCRGVLWTGFGWGAIGYAHGSGPLAWLAPWVGAYGMAFVAAAGSAYLASREVGLFKKGFLVAAFAAGGMLMNGQAWTNSTGRISVALLQGNIAQDEKFQPGSGIPEALNWYAKALTQAQAQLVVAPETAIPLLPQQLAPEYWDGLRQHFRSGEALALIGMPWGSYSEGYTNSVVALQPGTDTLWRYDKHHLVPFGEFIPSGFKWFTRMMNIPLGDFNRGPVGVDSIAWQWQRLGLNFCYEDLFGEELGARFAQPGKEPTVFVNVSNIAWFGNTVAIDQHLQISRMRALEFQRPMVRATNTGATAIIDHHGQVREILNYHTRGSLTGQVEGRTGTTPFANWVSRWGLWPLWALGGAVVVWAWQRQRKVAAR